MVESWVLYIIRHFTIKMIIYYAYSTIISFTYHIGILYITGNFEGNCEHAIYKALLRLRPIINTVQDYISLRFTFPFT